MKKFLFFLSICSITSSSTLPLISKQKNHTIEIEKDFNYNFDFNDLNLDNIDFNWDGEIFKSEIKDKEFTDEFKKCINEMNEFIKDKKSIKSEVIELKTEFDNRCSIAKEFELKEINTAFDNTSYDANKFKDHRLIIEKFNELYYINVVANYYIDQIKGKKSQLRLFAIDSIYVYKNLNDIKKNFKNTFKLRIQIEKNIEGHDEEFYDFEIVDVQELRVKQIRLWLDKALKNKKDPFKDIVDHIFKMKKVKLEKFDPIINIYKYKEINGNYEPCEKYKNDDDIVKGEYCYIGLKNENEAKGEYKILFKNPKY